MILDEPGAAFFWDHPLESLLQVMALAGGDPLFLTQILPALVTGLPQGLLFVGLFGFVV